MHESCDSMLSLDPVAMGGGRARNRPVSFNNDFRDGSVFSQAVC